MGKKSGRSKAWKGSKSHENENENEYGNLHNNEPVVSKENVKLYKQLQLLKNKNVTKYYKNVDEINRQRNEFIRLQQERKRKFIRATKEKLSELPYLKNHVETFLSGEPKKSLPKKYKTYLVNRYLENPKLNYNNPNRVEIAAEKRKSRLLSENPQLRRKISTLNELGRSQRVRNFLDAQESSRFHTTYDSTPAFLKAVFKNNLRRLSGHNEHNSGNEENFYWSTVDDATPRSRSFSNNGSAGALQRHYNNGSAGALQRHYNNGSAGALPRHYNNGSAGALPRHYNNGSATAVAAPRRRSSSSNGSSTVASRRHSPKPAGKLPPSEQRKK
jgi:hypothetical protein